MSDFVIHSKKKKEYEQFTCRIETELLDNIRKIVNENDLTSINEFINECLRYAIPRVKITKD